MYSDSTDTDKGMEMSRHFARFMVKLSGQDIPGLYLAAGLVSWYTSQGHVCLNLSQVAGKPQTEVWDKGEGHEPFPEFDNWIEALKRAPVVGQPGEFKPLVLDESGRLYLYRYWEYEQIIARGLMERVAEPCGPLDMALLKDGLTRLFPDSDRKGEACWPKIAALTAVSRRFCVISGGPGTGKTSTVVKVLALLLEQAAGSRTLRIALAAPTGKAAGRLKESIRTAKMGLACLPETRQLIPEDVATIHRLLGTIRGSARFYYHEGNPLPHDVVVIDEASMIDLPLMAKLVQALPEKAQLILLGDKDQLASVEAGAVLGDICDTGRARPYSPEFAEMADHLTGDRPEEADDPVQKSGLHGSIVLLRKSYRFGEGSGIGLLSQAVHGGEGQKSLDLLKNPPRQSGEAGRISWRPCPPPSALAEALSHLIIQGYSRYLKADSPDKAFRLFNQFRILCALRRGPYGVAEVNALAERVLRRIGLIRPYGRWYQGQPIMITRNDYQLEFFNGDVGLILPDPAANGDLKAFFPTSDGAMRKILPGRLPEYETVYAITVHKSQGSEFDRVLLLLPDRDAEILTRELIYTGLTRARESVEIWGREEIFLKAVSRPIERQSGLRDLLWK